MKDEECLFASVPMPDYSWLSSILEAFHSNYSHVHPYLVIFICSVGIIMNVITMLVLVKPPMKCPVTVLLFAVAGCDLVVMSSYFIFVLHFLFIAANRCDPDDYSYGWALFMAFHAHTSVIFHATSIWLTVIIAQIRILTLTRKKRGRRMIVSIRFTIILIAITCFVMVFINVPNIMTFKIIQFDADSYLFCKLAANETTNASLPLISQSEEMPEEESKSVYVVVPSQENCWKLKLAFWSNGLCFKVFPCVLLTASIIVLVKIVADVSRQRRKLAKVLKRGKLPTDCISPILLCVLTIFLITELPQGILLLLTGVFASRTFHYQVYLPLGDFMDLLSLINSAVNFVIYCTMSKNFRRVLLQMMKDRSLSVNSFRDIDNATTVATHNGKDTFKNLCSEDLMNSETTIKKRSPYHFFNPARALLESAGLHRYKTHLFLPTVAKDPLPVQKKESLL